MGKDLKVPFPSAKNNEKQNYSKYRKVGSLNYAKRKEENERIQMENAKLYKKLVTAKGDMSVKDDNKNFMVHRKYVQHMSKVPQAHQYQSNISPERERSIDMT